MFSCFLARYLADAILFRWRRSAVVPDVEDVDDRLDALFIKGDGGGDVGILKVDSGGEGGASVVVMATSAGTAD